MKEEASPVMKNKTNSITQQQTPSKQLVNVINKIDEIKKGRQQEKQQEKRSPSVKKISEYELKSLS